MNIVRACPERKTLRNWIKEKCKVENPEAEIRIMVDNKLYPIAEYIDNPDCYEVPKETHHLLIIKKAAGLPEVSQGRSWNDLSKFKDEPYNVCSWLIEDRQIYNFYPHIIWRISHEY